jgi:SAM-dependent methyltransferase
MIVANCFEYNLGSKEGSAEKMDTPDDYSNQISLTAEKWNGIAAGWHAWMPKMAEWYLPATDCMLDYANIENGQNVLDIAAGDCSLSIAIADLVGPEGFVLAIDIAEDLLDLGRKTALNAGIKHLETKLMDGSNLDLPDHSFDTVTCSFALMFFPNAVEALKGFSRVLKPNGRLSLVVYGTNGSPEFSIALSVVREYLSLPSEKPAAHSLGEAASLDATFKKAGFINTKSKSFELPILMVNANDCVNYLQATSPTLNELISPLTNNEKKEIWEQVYEALKTFEGKKGWELEHKVIVMSGSPKASNV